MKLPAFCGKELPLGRKKRGKIRVSRNETQQGPGSALALGAGTRRSRGVGTSRFFGRNGLGAVAQHAGPVGLGDQPLVPPETWRTIADADGALVSAVLDGQRSPPMRIARELWPLLPTEGDEGARVLVRGRPELLREIACPGHGLDIDTLEDLPSWS